MDGSAFDNASVPAWKNSIRPSAGTTELCAYVQVNRISLLPSGLLVTVIPVVAGLLVATNGCIVIVVISWLLYFV